MTRLFRSQAPRIVSPSLVFQKSRYSSRSLGIIPAPRSFSSVFPCSSSPSHSSPSHSSPISPDSNSCYSQLVPQSSSFTVNGQDDQAGNDYSRNYNNGLNNLAGTRALPISRDGLSQADSRLFPWCLDARIISKNAMPRWFPAFLFSKLPKGFEKLFPSDKKPDPSDEPQGNEKKQDPADPLKPPSPERPDGGGGGNSNRNPFFGPRQLGNSATLLLLGCGLWAYYGTGWPSRRDKEITMQEFLSRFVAKGFVEQIDIINKEYARVILKEDIPVEVLQEEQADSTLLPGGHYCFRITSPEAFEHKLENFQQSIGLAPLEYLPVKHVQESDILSDIAPYFPIVALCLCSILALGRVASFAAAHNDPSKILRMKRANAVTGKDLKVKMGFKDVAGMRDAKKEVTEFVDFLRDPKKYHALGAHIPKGALLVGTPGTGKTLLAKAVAGEADVPFFSMSGSDFIEVFVGIGASRVRDLFAQARKCAPSIIFIDEIDAIGRKRGRSNFAGGGSDERESTLNQLLVEMDGFSSPTGVVVLGGTNRLDVLDPALLRPGRFDRIVRIERPDLSERTEIFRIHMKPLRLDTRLSTTDAENRLAALTPGFVGADIQNICNESAILAARRNASYVTMTDLENACEKVIGGIRKTSSFLTEDIRKIVAYHEAGHAVTAWFLQHAFPVLKISIVPRANGALGYAQNLPSEINLAPRQRILDHIAVCLGGRVCEELYIGTASTGAADDLQKSTKLAYEFVAHWGFSGNFGLLTCPPTEENSYGKNYSEATAEALDKAARHLVQDQYIRVKKLLTAKKDLVVSLSSRLLEQESVSFTDLKEILGERPFPIEKEYEQYLSTPIETSEPATDETICSEEASASVDSPSKNDNVSHRDTDENDPTCGPNRKATEKEQVPLEVVTASETLMHPPDGDYRTHKKEAMLISVNAPPVFSV